MAPACVIDCSKEAAADEKFVVAKSLTEDGRIGKVSDAQGIVVLRPMLAKRWTPVCREMLLKPLDHHIQREARYAATGKRTARARSLVPYAALVEAGHVPLVTAYWERHSEVRGHDVRERLAEDISVAI